MIGSSLLSVVDRMALEVFPEEGNVSTRNIGELLRAKANWFIGVALLIPAKCIS